MAETKTTGAITKATTNNGNAVEKVKQVKFKDYIKLPVVQQSLATTLGDMAKAKTFTASLVSAVSTNPELAACEPNSIVSAALLGEALKLSPSPQLGQYYMVPFADRKSGTKKATFQVGWKGYYQLAMRSGKYKKLKAVAIKDGELKSYNPITDEVDLEPIMDPVKRENANTVGYYAFFETVNGFQNAIYWSKEQMEAHALKYSKGYASDKKNRTNWTFWSKDFDSMALKTMYRQLISKYGIMSIEMDMTLAYERDMTTSSFNPDTSEIEEVDFFDGVEDGEIIDAETGEVVNDK